MRMAFAEGPLRPCRWSTASISWQPPRSRRSRPGHPTSRAAGGGRSHGPGPHVIGRPGPHHADVWREAPVCSDPPAATRGGAAASSCPVGHVRRDDPRTVCPRDRYRDDRAAARQQPLAQNVSRKLALFAGSSATVCRPLQIGDDASGGRAFDGLMYQWAFFSGSLPNISSCTMLVSRWMLLDCRAFSPCWMWQEGDVTSDGVLAAGWSNVSSPGVSAVAILPIIFSSFPVLVDS